MKFTLGYGRWTQIDLFILMFLPFDWLSTCTLQHADCDLIYTYGCWLWLDLYIWSYAILEHLSKKLAITLSHFSTNILDCSTRKKAVFFPLLTEEISLKRKKSAPRGVIRNPPNKAQYTNGKNTKSGCVLN